MIPISELKVRGVYKVKARNFHLAVWDGEDFLGVRYKFGGCYIDGELHWDCGNNNGTCKPEEYLCDLPPEIPLQGYVLIGYLHVKDARIQFDRQNAQDEEPEA